MAKTKAVAFLMVEFTRSRSIRAVMGLLDFLGGSTNLVYSVIRSLFRPPYYPGLLAEQCYSLGVKSRSIAAITALTTGMVMSLQFGYGLERFGGKLYVPRVVGLSIFREL